MKVTEAQQLSAVQSAQKRIIKAGFPFIKFELEAQLWRSDSSWGVQRCQTFIDEFVGPEMRSLCVFRRFYRDGSVDSELTLTLPTDKGHMVIKYMESFNALSAAINNGKSRMDVENAGLHICILKDRVYPCSQGLDPEKQQNFSEQVTKLLPAMIFLSSHIYKTRGMNYRPPKALPGKPNAVNIQRGSIEYRIFDTCYDKPTAVYDKIEVIAATLKYYSKRKNRLKLEEPLNVGNGGPFSSLFRDPALLLAMEAGLPYLKPKHKTLEQLKKERNLNLDGKEAYKQVLKLEAKLAQEVSEAISLWEKRAKLELRSFKIEIKDKKGWKSLETDNDKAFKYLEERGFIPRKPSKDMIAAHNRPTGSGSRYRIVPVTPRSKPLPATGNPGPQPAGDGTFSYYSNNTNI